MSMLVLSASLNPESVSRVLAHEAAEVLKQEGVAASLADLRELSLPFCDGATAYRHASVAPAQQLVTAASGIIVATPIYNYDVNAALKNFIELTGGAWKNKVVGFLCAGAGASSYMSIMGLANSLMLDFRCIVLPRFVYASESAVSDGKITDPEIAKRVGECVLATARLADAVVAAKL